MSVLLVRIQHRREGLLGVLLLVQVALRSHRSRRSVLGIPSSVVEIKASLEVGSLFSRGQVFGLRSIGPLFLLLLLHVGH